MIMSVGGRFPYLQKPESRFTAQGTTTRKLCGKVCVPSLNLLLCANLCMHKMFYEAVDSKSKHNVSSIHVSFYPGPTG